MKKYIFRLISVVLVVVMAVGGLCFQLSASAATYFLIDGYNFSPNINAYGGTIYSYEGDETDIVLPYSLATYPITALANYAFLKNTDITSVSFEKASELSSIGYAAFKDCTSLTSVVLSSSVTELSQSVFQNCTALTSVTIEAGLTDIPQQTFYNCTSLAEIVLPDSVETISRYAFAESTSLTYVTIPESVVSIGENAFLNCPYLTIKCYSGSYAEEYAMENNIPYEIIEDGFLIGDVDMNGTVEIEDVTVIQKSLANLLNLTEEQNTLADANGDGFVNIDDATQIQKYLADLIPSLG